MKKYFLLLCLFTFSIVSDANAGTNRIVCAYENLKDALTHRHSGNPLIEFDSNAPDIGLRFTGSGMIIEAGVIQRGQNAKLNAAIELLQSAGGELRSLKWLDSSGTKYKTAYFRLSKEGVPIIAIERGAEQLVIDHEMAHFLDWKAFRDRFIAEGLDRKTAAFRAQNALHSSAAITRYTETNAVNAEKLVMEANSLWAQDVMKRAVYPELTGITTGLISKRALTSKSLNELNQFMDVAIEKALSLRRIRIMELSEQIANPKTNFFKRLTLKKNLAAAQNFSTLWDEMTYQPKMDKITELFMKNLKRKPKSTPVRTPKPSIKEIYDQRLSKALQKNYGTN